MEGEGQPAPGRSLREGAPRGPEAPGQLLIEQEPRGPPGHRAPERPSQERALRGPRALRPRGRGTGAPPLNPPLGRMNTRGHDPIVPGILAAGSWGPRWSHDLISWPSEILRAPRGPQERGLGS